MSESRYDKIHRFLASLYNKGNKEAGEALMILQDLHIGLQMLKISLLKVEAESPDSNCGYCMSSTRERLQEAMGENK